MTRPQSGSATPPGTEKIVPGGPESPYAWFRLLIAVVLSTVGGVGMWSVQVALPAIQAEFGVARADASLPYTLGMVGFALGGVAMGRVFDRFGIVPCLFGGALLMGSGFVIAGLAPSLWQLTLAYGLLIGLGTSATFGPLMSDILHWFTRRRGVAVAIAAAGNYLAGTVWPPIVQYFVDHVGWRATHIGIGLLCAALMTPLSLLLRRRAPHQSVSAPIGSAPRYAPPNVSPATLQAMLMIAGVACCVAMAMPQVHIVAYCGDLGYGAARGAEMLSMMLGFGVVSRIASGFIADRIGGVATLLLGSVLQGLSLLLFLFFDGLASLYVISALFGLFQGGIVPMYAIIVRDCFPPGESGTRLGLVFMATLFGMAFGGWVSGLIFDLSGSYALAFVHGIGWNLVNVTIALWLILAPKRTVRSERYA